MKVAYFPEALEELEAAVRYYDKRLGLGDEFFDGRVNPVTLAGPFRARLE